MINGAHVIVYGRDAEAAVHPADGEAGHELYLMCDDIQDMLAKLTEKGVEIPSRS